MNKNPIILFDGHCNYCNSMVNFVIRRDREKIFRFAPLQSESGITIQKQFNIEPGSTDSFLLVDGDKIYNRSTAALRVLNKLSWTWKPVQVLRIVPSFIRDYVYDFIARNRYRWFGRKEECMVPTPDVRERFLP